MDQSTKRVDRRIARSRKAIIEAFARLLEKHDINKITVSAIAREANIDRKTFYVHFGTIDGLLDALAEDLVANVIDEVEEALDGHEAAEVPQRAVSSLFAIINESLSRNMNLNKRLVESSNTDMLIERIRKPFTRLVHERGSLDLSLVPEKHVDYYLSFLLGGIVSIYREWILEKNDVSIEQVSDIANNMTMYGLSCLESL